MRKIKEVLRLHYELRLNQRQIGRSCGIGQATVHEYLRRAEAAGVGWPLPDDWDENQLREKLFGPAVMASVEPPRTCPDFAAVHEQLQRHRHLTLRLIWEEHRQGDPGLRLQPLL